MKKWVRIGANMNLGAYEIFEPSSNLPEPKWPELTFKEILKVAFRDRIVDNLNHPIIQRLKGAV
jgi:hypothetical protein